MNRKLAHLLPSGLIMAVVLFGYTAVADSEFEDWKTRFRQTALDQGIHHETMDAAMRGLLPDEKVLRLEARQPEFTRTVWEYLDSAVSEERIATGQERLRQHASLLNTLYEQYGVQPHYLLAIWGLESNYGGHKGNYSTVRSLATLAYGGNEERRGFWEEQLLAALRILQRGDIAPVAMRGSWAGAIGHTQFIPTTFEEFAVDFDGDGKRDLVNSIPDALASTANYLARSGWLAGEPWGQEIRLPRSFDWSRADPTIWQAADQWTLQHCLLDTDGGMLELTDAPAFVLLPAGYRGPAFLAYRNFRVILKYNNAQSYGLAVGRLGDRINGAPPLAAAWPRNETPLSFDQKAELQQLLTTVGYNTDGVDGKIGPNTRSALRRWQTDAGFPADGYATLEHLEYLRKTLKRNSAGQSGTAAPSPKAGEG